MSDAALLDRVRLDVWLDVACLFKTRSEAQRACKGGKVEINGVRARPHRDVRRGDELVITRPLGLRQRIVVRDLLDRHVPKARARALYDDLTPPPTPEEVAERRMARLARARAAQGRPDKRQRRQLRGLKAQT